MSAERKIIMSSLNQALSQVSKWEKLAMTSEIAFKIESAVDQYKFDLDELRRITTAELSSYSRLDKPSAKVEQEEEAIMADYKAAQNTFYRIQGKLREIKDSFKEAVSRDSLVNPSTNLSFSSLSVTRLPKLQVPKFSGDSRDFLSFKNSFENIVKNSVELSNVQKLHYLQEALQGDAFTIVRDLPITENSFTEAWNMLIERYENIRSLIRIHFRDICAIEQIKSETEIRDLLNKFTSVVRALKLCGVGSCKGENCSFFSFLSYILASKLDRRTSRDWENSLTETKTFPSYEKLVKFLQTRSFSCENREEDTRSPDRRNVVRSPPEKSSDKSTGKQKKQISFVVTKPMKCHLCSGQHFTDKCDLLVSKKPSERFEFVKHRRLCTNCLSSEHRTVDCKSTYSCKSCNGRHHTSLHLDNKPVLFAPASKADETGKSIENSSSSLNISKTVMTASDNRKSVILPTAVVRVEIQPKTGFRKYVPARILFDQGSQVNIVSEEFVRKNRITTHRTNGTSFVTGINDRDTAVQFSSSLRIRSRYADFELQFEADVIRKIPFVLLSDHIREIKSKNPNLSFAEQDISHGNVDILIGAEYCELCANDSRMFDSGVFLRDSKFGWLISGSCAESAVSKNHCNLTIIALEDQLKRFWSVEEAASVHEISSEHELCTEHFDKTYSRDNNGRFVARLPTKCDRKKLGDSYPKAVSALRRIEKKTDPETRRDYVKFLEEYEAMDHMEKVPGNLSESSTEYYIPHRAVLRPSSTTTKIRVVFNASAKTSSDLSLNDILMTGPAIQSDLMDILIRFRTHPIAFTADVEKMYRQILVHEDDRDLQRILWRVTPSDPIERFRLKTITYGTAPASFIATKCLSILGDEISKVDPESSRIIKEDFYMDDLLTGAATVEKARKLQLSIHGALQSGCFQLRKYASNSSELLKSLTSALIEEKKAVNIEDSESTSVLGLKWNAKDDVFSVNLENLSEESFENLSKRRMLSVIARTFDPLGFLSPVTIRAKIMLQQLWKEALNWDDPVTLALKTNFVEYYRDLSALRDLSFPRKYSNFGELSSRQLIGFCDASEKAYSAIVYLRSVNSENEVQCSLVCAKTRVAPMKELTIPKLELQAALLLAELINRIARVLSIDISKAIVFSDSTVALCWITGVPLKWTVFVKNRVVKIGQIISPSQWRYVKTTDNPADLATRGLKVCKFKANELWPKGPPFLYESDTSFEWAIPKTKLKSVPEVREINVVCLAVVNANFELIEKYSSFQKLVGVAAYMLRYINILRRKVARNTDERIEGSLTVEERSAAIKVIIKAAQSQSFEKEIASILGNHPLGKRSSLRTFDPFLDEQGILRVGGRLKNSAFSFEKRHPAILHAKSHLTTLLIRHLHEKFYHATRSFIRNHLAHEYWIIGGLTNVMKKTLRTCVVCIRYRVETPPQIMGQLPALRVTPDRPFSTVGVDFAGPFSCKCVSHRSTKFSKVYAAFYVCFCTRAIHIEVVSSLSTEAFLDSFRRFSARRGIPHHVYSDNGTNFVGAQRYISWDQTKVRDHVSKINVDWTFIPPRAPNKGGLWESAVRSAKYHLVRVTNGQPLNYEEYCTLFTEIEAILNSRPLCYRPFADSSEQIGEALTPAHFIIGSSLTVQGAVPSEGTKLPLLRRYELIHSQRNSFWSRWSRDYLNQYQQRYKWSYPARNVQRGDIVILKDELSIPANWSLGIVQQVFPDRQGHVRIVDVKTAVSVKRRALNSLVVLLPSEPQGSAPGTMFAAD